MDDPPSEGGMSEDLGRGRKPEVHLGRWSPTQA